MMIIAEIGLNHNGNMQLARCLIEEAAAAGADVAKFQFFDISKYFGPEFEWYDACMKARLDFEQASALKAHCDAVGIEFCASAFDVEGVEWCERLGVTRHKLASRCIRQDDVIQAMADTGKPMIVSLGLTRSSRRSMRRARCTFSIASRSIRRNLTTSGSIRSISGGTPDSAITRSERRPQRLPLRGARRSSKNTSR